VLAGTSTGRPARSTASRAMFSPCVPSGIAHPQNTSSIVFGSTPLFSTAALSTVAERSIGCTLANDPSFFPRPTADRTAETMTASLMVDSPCRQSARSMTRALSFASVSQWLAGLERVRDALLRFFRSEEREECFALEVENVLLGDVAGWPIASGQDVGEVLR